MDTPTEIIGRAAVPAEEAVRGSADGEVRCRLAGVADSILIETAGRLSSELQVRYPYVSPVLIVHSIDTALQQFASAPVRQFLPILIERSASDAIRVALKPHTSDGSQR